MTTHADQLRSIHAMLAAGQRCVELERHTLLLWGGVGGTLCAFTDLAITAERFPLPGERGLALLVWLAFWLGATGWLDQRLTRRARCARGESLPFAQAQITRAWWMLFMLGTLGSFATFFHGGGVMVYALWAVLLGLGIFFFGLFSRALIEWIGVTVIVLGAAGLAAGVPLHAARWLTAACFAVGLPLAGWLARQTPERPLLRRTAALGVWLLAVLSAAAAGALLFPAQRNPETSAHVLTLPAGTVLPLAIDLDSRVVSIEGTATLPVRLQRPIDVVLIGGQPDGRFRIDGGPWRSVQGGGLRLFIDRVQPQIGAAGPEIRAHGLLEITGSEP